MSELLKKYESIDQSKLNEATIKIINRVKTITADFTADDEKNNKIAEQVLDSVMQKNPDAVKIVKREPKAKPAPKKTHKATHTAKATHKATSAPATKNSDNNIMTVAKQIQNAGESWKDAMERAKVVLKQRKEKVVEKKKTELEKLYALVKTKKELQGFANSDIKRDAVREAKVKGARFVSKEGSTSNAYGTFPNKIGRKYWETRDRHSDRLAPNYPKDMPLLAKGGGVDSRYVIRFEDSKGNKESMRTDAYNKAEAMKVGKFFEGKAQFKGFKVVSVSEIEEEFANGGSTKKYRAGQKFYDTRYDRVCEIVPSNYEGMVSWKRYNKSGTEFENDTQHSLVEDQFDYLVNMGAYQISKQSMAKGGGIFSSNDLWHKPSNSYLTIDNKSGVVKNVKEFNGNGKKEINIDGDVYRKNTTYGTYNSIKDNTVLTKQIVEKNFSFADGGSLPFMTDPNFGNFQNTGSFAKGGKFKGFKFNVGDKVMVNSDFDYLNIFYKYEVPKTFEMGYDFSKPVTIVETKINSFNKPFYKVKTAPTENSPEGYIVYADLPEALLSPAMSSDKDSDVKIKDWYMKTYPTDDLGEELNDEVTFEDMWNEDYEKYDIYQVMGVGDSVIRERLFEHLAEIKGVSYSDVYRKLFSSDGFYADGGSVSNLIRMYNFLKDDLVQLEEAIKSGDFEEVNRFFSYWLGSSGHLKSLQTMNNQRMYMFLQEDLNRLMLAVENEDKEEVERFFSYWGQHLPSIIGTDIIPLIQNETGKIWEKNNPRLTAGVPPENFEKNWRKAQDEAIEKLKNEGKIPEDLKFEDIGFMTKNFADGGSLPFMTDPNFGNFQNTGSFADGGSMSDLTEQEFLKKYFGANVFTENPSQYFEIKKMSSSDDNKVDAFIKELKSDGFTVKKRAFSDFTSVMGVKKKASFELGGAFMMTDLAGHTGGSDGLGNPMPLDGFSGTNYTGLVGETGAMSSGELFEAGGAMMQNQQVINDASQSYVNYYLNDGGGVFKDGGSIPNNYEGRTPEDVWTNLTIEQRKHFLFDHQEELPERFTGYYVVNELAKRDFDNSPKEVQFIFGIHVETGQYASGGSLGKTLYVEYSSYFDSNNYDEEKIMSALKSIGAKNIRLENDRGWSNQPEVVVFNGDKNKAEEALNEAFDTDYIRVREKDWRTKKMADGGFMDNVYAKGGMLNKKVNDELKFYIGNIINDVPMSEWAVKTILKSALTDANFHNASKEVDSIFKRAKYTESVQFSKLQENAMTQRLENKGREIAKMCDYDAFEIIDSIAFYVSMNMGRPLGEKIENLKNIYAKGGSVDDSVIDELWNGYASALLFTETDSDSGEPLDSEYSISDFDKETVASSKKMLAEYYSKNKEAIEESELDLDTIGNDIWYTRSGQGAGFFDHSLDAEVEEKLTKGAKELGEYPSVETYDGKISVRGGKVFAKGGGLSGARFKFDIGDKVMIDDRGYVTAFTEFDLSKPAEIIDRSTTKMGGKTYYFYKVKMADGRVAFNQAEQSKLTLVEKGSFAKGGFVGTVEFNAGDTVWQKDEKRYATVMDNYGDPVNGSGGDIRLDTSGNTNIFTYDKKYNRTGYNLVKVGDKGDTGKFTPEVLADMKASANRLIDSNGGRKDPSDVAYYKGIYKRLLDGEFDSMVGGAKATTSNKKGSSDYTYVPNKDVKELSVVLKGELKELMGSDILDGVYVKNSAKPLSALIKTTTSGKVTSPNYPDVKFNHKVVINGKTVNLALSKSYVVGGDGTRQYDFIDVDGNPMTGYGRSVKEALAQVELYGNNPIYYTKNTPPKIDESKAHFKMDVSGGGKFEVFVDSNFVNQSQGNLPNTELKHYGFGDFYLQTPDGNIDFIRTDEEKEGFVGRTHKMKGSDELVLKLVNAMKEKGRFESTQTFADGGFMNNVYAKGGGVEDISKSLSVNKLYDQDGNLMGYTIKDKYNVKGKYTLSNSKEQAEENLQYLIDNPSRLAYYRKNEYADGGFMNNVYADGGELKIKDLELYKWYNINGKKLRYFGESNGDFAFQTENYQEVLFKKSQLGKSKIINIYANGGMFDDNDGFMNNVYAKGGKIKVGGDDFSFLLDLSDKELQKRLDLVNMQKSINAEQYFKAKDKKENTSKIEEAGTRLDNQWYAIVEARNRKNKNYADGGEMQGNNIDAELEDFDIDNLDPFETMQYSQFVKSSGKVGALQVLINSVEGDYSQLSPELAELAEMQMSQEDWDDATMDERFERDGYANGGSFEDNDGFMRADNENNYRFPERPIHVDTLDEPIDLTDNVSYKPNEVVIESVDQDVNMNEDGRIRARMTQSNRGSAENFAKINPNAFEFIPMPTSNKHKND